MKAIRPYKVITGLLAVMMTCISCEKLIEVDLPANQIKTEEVFKDVATANAVLSGLYAGLWENSPVAGDQSGRILGGYTDDLTYYGTTGTNGILEISGNTLIDSNPAVYAYWLAAYQKLYSANAILEGLENAPELPLADKQRIKGETLFIRSLLLFYLQQIYGAIPYPVSTNYEVNKSLNKLSSVAVVQLLESDLKEAISLLADQYRNAERIFVNRKTVQLLLAKVYMEQQKWDLAEEQLKAVVESPLYQFENDVTKVFYKAGTHILWQLKPKNNGDATKEAQTYYFINAAPSSFSLSQSLVDAFSVADLRRQNWMAVVTVGANSWYRANKYKVRSNNTTEYSIVFRLEEVYLLLAESLGRQDKVEEAVPYVNATRKRAGLSTLLTTISPQVLLDEILQENRREFFTEMGHRFMDLKRAGQLNTLVQSKPNWKEFHRLWPIPQKDILLNANLKPQNTGY